MTEEQIMKALEYHRTTMENHCNECPYKGRLCSIALPSDTLDLINRQKAEIINRTEEYNDMLEQRNKVVEALDVMAMDVNSLTSERDALNEMVAEQKAEIERLEKELDAETNHNERLYKKIDRLVAGAYNINQIKSEAIKEFAERLKEKFSENKYILPSVNISVDNLVKEMTEQ